MRSRYVAWDPRKHDRETRFKELQRIFNYLLMKSGGQVEPALAWLQQLADRYGWFDEDYDLEAFSRDLLELGQIVAQSGADAAAGGGSLRLTGQGERALRRQALERIFQSLAAGSGGDHRTPHVGGGGEETDETRPWSFGSPLDDIAWSATMRNALARSAVARSGSLDGWHVREDDLEVRERESHTGCATVLLVDVSHSMILYGEDRMLPAREVALALLELITSRFKKDTLDLILFGDDAKLVPLEQIPYIQAGPYHTNTKAGLQLAQDVLRRRVHVNKQIFMITDGKPSAIFRDGRIYKNPFGLDEEVVNRTLDEAVRCRRAGITITTFMVARDPLLVSFIEELTQLNQGRAYFTGTGNLGETLFVDYMRNRRALL